MDATFVADAGSHRELLGRPGAIAYYDGGGVAQKGHDACCPGCGQFVAQMSVASGHPLVGDPEAPSTTKMVRFGACCGWMGVMTNGVWRELRGD